jgi:phosphoacetylglucosamine mutase
MLAAEWEAHATALATSTTAEHCVECINSILEAENIHIQPGCFVYIGQDTRPSSPLLADTAAAGVRAMGAAVEALDVCTTPLLHFAVWLQEDGWWAAYQSRLSQALLQLAHGEFSSFGTA